MQKSFFPEATKLWNRLPEDIKHTPTIRTLKDKLHDCKEPSHYYKTGSRKGQILHAGLRLKCNDLYNHSVVLNIVDNQCCTYGTLNETVNYFLV